MEGTAAAMAEPANVRMSRFATGGRCRPPQTHPRQGLLDAYSLHSAAIFVIQSMAVKPKITGEVGVLHAQVPGGAVEQ